MKKFFTILIVLVPIFSSYSVVAGLDLGYMLMALMTPFVLLFCKRTMWQWPASYMAFVIYALVDSLLLLHNIPLRIILYTIALVGACTYVDKKYLLIVYEKVVFICCAFFLVQCFFSIILHVNIPGIATFIPTIYGDEVNVYEMQLEGDRLSSFFLEPSYFAQYLYPYLCLKLFVSSNKADLKKAIIVSAILILLKSGTGYILMLIIWLIWFLRSNIKKTTKIGMVSLIAVAAVVAIKVNPDLLEYVVDRSSEFSFSEGYEAKFKSSGYLRFFNGYVMYSMYPLLNKLVGMNPTEFASSSYNLGNFLNGVSTVLLLHGAIGLILFVPHLIHLGRKSSKISVVMVWCIVYLMLSEAYFISSRMMFAVVITYIFSSQFVESNVESNTY